MVTDEMMDAIDLMIATCANEEQRKGMEAVKEMLGEFETDKWLDMNPYSSDLSECYEWVKKFIPCN